MVPGEWKRMPELDRLVILRTLRPERLTAALGRFVAAAIGQQYITSQPFSLERSFQVRPPIPHDLTSCTCAPLAAQLAPQV